MTERDTTPPIHGPGSEREPVKGTPPEFTDPEPQELPETPPADPVARDDATRRERISRLFPRAPVVPSFRR